MSDAIFSPTRPTTSAGNGLHAVVQELRGPTTLLWQAPANDPDQRTMLAVLSHRDGYGPRVSLSPNGQQLALTLLPPDAEDLETGARLSIVGLASGEPRTIREGVDLRGTPVWHPDGNALAVRTWKGDVPQLAVVGRDGDRQGEAAWSGALHLSPIGWDVSGRLLAAAMRADGFDLVAPFTAEVVAKLSEGPARDFRLAPDGTRLSYLADLSVDGATLRMIALREGASAPNWELLASNVFGAVWQADGRSLTPSRRFSKIVPVGKTAGNALLQALPEQDKAHGRLEIPVGAGPDGWLAVRSIESQDSQRPQMETLWLVRDQVSALIQGEGPVEFVGWRMLP